MTCHSPIRMADDAYKSNWCESSHITSHITYSANIRLLCIPTIHSGVSFTNNQATYVAGAVYAEYSSIATAVKWVRPCFRARILQYIWPTMPLPSFQIHCYEQCIALPVLVVFSTITVHQVSLERSSYQQRRRWHFQGNLKTQQDRQIDR